MADRPRGTDRPSTRTSPGAQVVAPGSHVRADGSLGPVVAERVAAGHHETDATRDVFQVGSAVVVTQSAHVGRAVDLGDAAGIDTQGHVVCEGGRRGREVLARVRGRPGLVVRRRPRLCRPPEAATPPAPSLRDGGPG